jgi:DNA-binding response OmpR family regulator
MLKTIDTAANTTLSILLLEEDDDAQRGLKKSLRGLGFRVLLAVELQDAYDWLSNGFVPADLVLVNLLNKSPSEALDVGRKLRLHAQYTLQTPLVVMAERFGPELEGTDDNVSDNDWVSYPEDSKQLHSLLLRLTDRRAA